MITKVLQKSELYFTFLKSVFSSFNDVRAFGMNWHYYINIIKNLILQQSCHI